jgi:hypothetical protein
VANLKTTIAGITGGLLLVLPQIQNALTTGAVINWWQVGLGFVVAVLGILAKDFNVTGGTTQQ